MHALSRARFTDSDEESPVVLGTKMVERVVNMRKLAPPKHDDPSANNNSYGKSSTGSSGFGTTLSKKSLDMAMRHMVCSKLHYIYVVTNDFVVLVNEYN
jgi:hypothetical protein